MTRSQRKPKTIADLNRIYDKAQEVDSALFSEQRSNVLLSAGDHYSKKNSQFWSRIRDSVQLNDEQKLRLTKNHCHRITNTYINNITALAPGVAITPKNEKELQDQKAAELNDAVWKDWKQKVNYREQVIQDACDFVRVGEVAAKIYFEPNKGEVIAYEQLLDPMGEPVFEPLMNPDGSQAVDFLGQPMTDPSRPVPDHGKPVFSGEICYERIFAPNLLRESTSKDSIYDGMLIYRKMVDKSYLQDTYAGDDDKLKLVQETGQDTYTVFDGQHGNPEKVKDQVMIREYYEPKCYEYPNGYFWITTSLGILEEGELPDGIFPIIFGGFDDIQTSPRKRSIIKVIRPYQAEINRTASKIAETQISFDDKLVTMTGTKMTQGAKLPGIRQINVSGAPPTILQGRAGDQYLEYLNSQIRELYQAVNLEEENLDKTVQSTDSVAELLKIARHKKKFSMYAEKFEWYQVKKCETVLKLAKFYYNEGRLIPAIGRAEQVNIAEFKNSTPLCYQISLEPSNDDYETKFGKHLTFTTVLQYVGGQLSKDDIGKILRAMPYANNEKSFEDFTLNYDIAVNMMLALERGEMPASNPNFDHKYILAKLGKRTTEADFQFLAPEIQQAYMMKMAEHQQFEVEQILKIKRAQEDLIPAQGSLVKADIYVDDPENPGKSARAKFPVDSLKWLQDRLSEQGIEMEQLEKIQQGQVAEMADQFLNSLGNSPDRRNFPPA